MTYPTLQGPLARNWDPVACPPSGACQTDGPPEQRTPAASRGSVGFLRTQHLVAARAPCDPPRRRP